MVRRIKNVIWHHLLFQFKKKLDDGKLNLKIPSSYNLIVLVKNICVYFLTSDNERFQIIFNFMFYDELISFNTKHLLT